MRLLKKIEEYRVDSELEAKEAMEKFRSEATANDYSAGACGYTYKEKKSKGEIIDEAWIVKVVEIYGGIWD